MINQLKPDDVCEKIRLCYVVESTYKGTLESYYYTPPRSLLLYGINSCKENYKNEHSQDTIYDRIWTVLYPKPKTDFILLIIRFSSENEIRKHVIMQKHLQYIVYQLSSHSPVQKIA